MLLCCFLILRCLCLQNEVDLLSNIHHPNIISLLGYSVHNDTRFIVYELMQNGSLEIQLHGKSFILLLIYRPFFLQSKSINTFSF